MKTFGETFDGSKWGAVVNPAEFAEVQRDALEHAAEICEQYAAEVSRLDAPPLANAARNCAVRIREAAKELKP